MIDIESEIFTRISKKIKESFPNAFVAGEYVKSPPAFPSVSVCESDNYVYTDSQDSSNTENHAELAYEINVFSNKQSTKKTECKKIMAIIDNELSSMGFTRSMINSIPNEEDATIYRMVARYSAIVSKNKTIYRR